MSSSDAAGLPAPLLLKFSGVGKEEILAPTPPAQAAEDDDSLMLRLQSGDREALGILFVRYARLVMSVGQRVLRDRAEAEDLLHDVFLLLLNKSELFDPKRGSARAWLAKITYRRALNRREYLARRCFYDTRSGSDSDSVVAGSAGSSGPEAVELSYWQSRLQQAFDCLSPDQRATLKLHFFEGLTIDEISARLGKSPVNIRNYYYRGLERLRRRMFPRLDEAGRSMVTKSRIPDGEGESR